MRDDLFSVVDKELLKKVKEKLKECKQEWLDKNAKGQPALGVSTVIQILDNAVEEATSWDFIIEEQWREEVSKFNKNGGTWAFDGYVYHVRGVLIIHGIGRRTQYGSKVAVGGKDNQNSSYKAAASDCLKKCASLFGVGSSIYSRIQIESDELDSSYNQQQQYQQPQQQYQQQQQQQQQYQPQQQQQAQQPETYVNADGFHQNGEYIWINNAWIHQSEYYAQQQQAQQQQPQQQAGQGGQYPTAALTPEQEKSQWYYDTMQQNDPKGHQQMVNDIGPSPLDQKTQEAMAYADQQAQSGTEELPFENVPKQAEQSNFQAEPQAGAEPQAQAEQQNFEATPSYGAPVGQSNEQPVAKEKVEDDPLKDVKPENPWGTPETTAQLEVFKEHKTRLGISQDSHLLPHVREYFKDEDATIASITPETLVGFNTHLQNIQV